jgi:hypothetical protein
VLDPRHVVFGGATSLFPRGSPRRWKTQHMVAPLRRSPRRWWSWAQSSSTVAMGCSRTNWRTGGSSPPPAAPSGPWPRPSPQGGPRLLSLRPRAGRLGATGLLQQDRPDLLRRVRIGAIVERPVTTISFFLPCFCPWPKRAGGVWVGGGAIGTPEPSACTTRVVPIGAGSTGSTGYA